MRLTVTNLGDLFAGSVAESCLAGVLALHRGIDELAVLRTRGTWAQSAVRPRLRLLSGSRVLVLGRGSIARRFAELLGPFGCRVSHFARGSGDIRTPAELDERLPGFDVVVGLLPGTPETNRLLDARPARAHAAGGRSGEQPAGVRWWTRRHWSASCPPGGSAVRCWT